MSSHKATRHRQNQHIQSDAKDDDGVRTRQKDLRTDERLSPVDIHKAPHRERDADSKATRVERAERPERLAPVMECPYVNGFARSDFPLRRGWTRSLITREPMYRSAAPPQRLQNIIDDHSDRHDDLPFVSFVRGGYIAREPNGKFMWKHPAVNDHSSKWYLLNHIIPFYDCRRDSEDFARRIERGVNQLSAVRLNRIDQLHNRYKRWLRHSGRIIFSNLNRNVERGEDIVQLCCHDYRLHSLCDGKPLAERLRSTASNLREVDTVERTHWWPENAQEHLRAACQRDTTRSRDKRIHHSYRKRLSPVMSFLQSVCEARTKAAREPCSPRNYTTNISRKLAEDARANNPIDIRLCPSRFLDDIRSTGSNLHNVYRDGGDTARRVAMHHARMRARRGCQAKIIANNASDIRLCSREFLRNIQSTKRNLSRIPAFTRDIMEYRLNNACHDRSCQAYLADRVRNNCQPWRFANRTRYNVNHSTPGCTHGVTRVQPVRSDSHGRNVCWITPAQLKKVRLNRIGINNIPAERRTISDILALLRETTWCFRGDPKFIARDATRRRRRGSFFSQVLSGIKRTVGMDDSNVRQQRRDYDYDRRCREECERANRDRSNDDNERHLTTNTNTQRNQQATTRDNRDNRDTHQHTRDHNNNDRLTNNNNNRTNNNNNNHGNMVDRQQNESLHSNNFTDNRTRQENHTNQAHTQRNDDRNRMDDRNRTNEHNRLNDQNQNRNDDRSRPENRNDDRNRTDNRNRNETTHHTNQNHNHNHNHTNNNNNNHNHTNNNNNTRTTENRTTNLNATTNTNNNPRQNDNNNHNQRR